jgi:hypothetical protein
MIASAPEVVGGGRQDLAFADLIGAGRLFADLDR